MASGKTLQSTIEISGVLSPSLQAAINSAVDRLADMAEETLDSADAASRLVAEMSSQEDVLKTLQKAYAGYVASGEEGSEKAQDLANRIRVVSGELEENRETLRAAEKAANSLTDTQEDAADAYTKLERKINSQQDELSALRREYANVALEQGENSEEARQLESKIGSLSRELAKNERQLREVGDAAEDAGKKAENSGEGYTVLKNVIANLATEAIDMAVEGFKELVTEGDTALAMLEARTGATEGKMEGFEDVMYEVYNANYGESLGYVSEKLSTVIQMTDDLDNASLAKVTKNAIALEDVFGFDVMESMRGVNSLMDQFGITSDQAFNLITQGAQNGLNQNDDLMDVINEYAVQFKDAGYTADDMFNMLANGAATGTWSVDKLGDAMKEFNIRMSDGTANDYLKDLGVDADAVVAKFNKGGPEAQAAIGTVMKAIQDCDDKTLQYQAGVGIFGTMWEDLGADTVASLMQTEGAISSTNDAMAQMDAAAYDTLEKSVSQLGRTIKTDVLQPIAEGLTPALKGVVDFATNNLPAVGVIIGGVTAAIAAFKIAAWSAKLATEGFTIATKLQAIAQGALNAVMNANPIGLIILAITALVAGFMILWNNCEGFRNFWIGLWEGIKTAASAAGEWLKGVWTSITSAFSNAWNSITSFLSGAWQTIKNVVQVGIMAVKGIISAAFQLITLPFRFIWENCKDTIMAAWNAIKEKVTTALNAIKTIISNVWNAIKGVIMPIITAIVNFVKQRWENLKNNVLTVFNAVKTIATNVWNGIKTSISNVVNGIKNTVSNIFDSIKSKVSGVFNSIKSIASSVWNGIKSAITTPINAAKDAVKAAIDKIKGFFNFKWSLPKLKLPHFSIEGKFSLNPPSVPKLAISWYKDGGILTQPTIFGAAGNTLLAGGEAGAEAVVPLAVLWEKLETLIRSVFNSASSTGGTPDAGLTSKAGELLTLDDFSLGSLADGTSVVIYYDFSGFTWSPQIQTNGSSDNEDDLMARLKAHEAEFFDWLEEFIKMREVAQYA